jgi:peptidoglycan-associated lipoprotein
MNRLIFSILLAAALAACSSVQLADVPVEDKSPGSSAMQREGRGDATESSVAPLTVDSAHGSATGPTGVERVLYFDYDSYAIKPEFESLIEAHARFLKASASRRVSIEGHTDERGGREYNLALGQRRSEAVRRALRLLGTSDSQVEAVSFGEEKPAMSGREEAAWARNRRAEISYR